MPFLGIFVADQAAALSRWCDLQVCTPVDLTVRSEEVAPGQVFRGCPKYRSRSQPDLFCPDGLTPEPLDYHGRLFRHTFAKTTARNLARSLESLDLTGIDLVHAHTLFPDGLACAYWLEDKRVPLVVTAHGSDVHSMMGRVRRAMGPLLRRVDRLIAVSGALRRQLEAIEVPPRKISVLPNGFSANLFNGTPVNSERGRNIIFLGQPRPVKRVDLLIRALEFCDPDITLSITGNSRLVGSLKSLARQLKVEDRVQFLGNLNRDQIPQVLSQAALLCLVSSREGWPTVIFEALACGTPVLATAVGGVPEAVCSPDLGLLVPQDVNPRELAGTIMDALEKKWNHQAIRDHAAKYSWEAIGEEMYGIYQQVIGSGIPQPSSRGY